MIRAKLDIGIFVYYYYYDAYQLMVDRKMRALGNHDM